MEEKKRTPSELKSYELPIKELLLKFIPTLSEALNSNSNTKPKIVNAFLKFTGELVELLFKIKQQHNKDINLVTLGNKFTEDNDVQSALTKKISPVGQHSILMLMEACAEYNADTVDARIKAEPNTLPENAFMLASLRGGINLIYSAFTQQMSEASASGIAGFKEALALIPITHFSLAVPMLGEEIPPETQQRMFNEISGNLVNFGLRPGRIVPIPDLEEPKTPPLSSSPNSTFLQKTTKARVVWNIICWIIFVPLTVGELILRCADWLGDKVNRPEFAPIAKFVSKFFKFFFWPDKLIEEYQAYIARPT